MDDKETQSAFKERQEDERQGTGEGSIGSFISPTSDPIFSPRFDVHPNLRKSE
jgi:hypothetical protein